MTRFWSAPADKRTEACCTQRRHHPDDRPPPCPYGSQTPFPIHLPDFRDRVRMSQTTGRGLHHMFL